MIVKKKPTAAQVKKILLTYESGTLNPVLDILSNGPRLEQYDDLEHHAYALHEWLRVLHDDIDQGLVDWEE